MEVPPIMSQVQAMIQTSPQNKKVVTIAKTSPRKVQAMIQTSPQNKKVITVAQITPISKKVVTIAQISKMTIAHSVGV